MTDAEISGVVELGKPATLNGFRIEIVPTRHPRKFFIRVRPVPGGKRPRVRNYRPLRDSLRDRLTDGDESVD